MQPLFELMEAPRGGCEHVKRNVSKQMLIGKMQIT